MSARLMHRAWPVWQVCQQVREVRGHCLLFPVRAVPAGWIRILQDLLVHEQIPPAPSPWVPGQTHPARPDRGFAAFGNLAPAPTDRGFILILNSQLKARLGPPIVPPDLRLHAHNVASSLYRSARRCAIWLLPSAGAEGRGQLLPPAGIQQAAFHGQRFFQVGVDGAQESVRYSVMETLRSSWAISCSNRSFASLRKTGYARPGGSSSTW